MIFDHIDLKLPQLERETIDGVRYYKVPDDEELIKEIHKLTVDKILEPEKCGIFRKTQVVVKNSLTGEVSFKPPMAVAVLFQIKDLVLFINSHLDIHSVLKSGTVHYELVRIHPFLDGNGRVGRLLIVLYFISQGVLEKPLLYIADFFEKNKIKIIKKGEIASFLKNEDKWKALEEFEGVYLSLDVDVLDPKESS